MFFDIEAGCSSKHMDWCMFDYYSHNMDERTSAEGKISFLGEFDELDILGG